MPHHHTKNTVGVVAWCNTCNRRTIHSVSGKRIGACTEHAAAGMSKKQEQQQKVSEREAQNLRLF